MASWGSSCPACLDAHLPTADVASGWGQSKPVVAVLKTKKQHPPPIHIHIEFCRVM